MSACTVQMQVAQQPALLGVTRSPWSVTWDAHVAAAGAGAQGAQAVSNATSPSIGDADKASNSGTAAPQKPPRKPFSTPLVHR